MSRSRRAPTTTPLGMLRSLAALRRGLMLYPAGHVVIDQNAAELEREVRKVVEEYGRFRVEIVGGTAHIDGYPFRLESLTNQELIADLVRCGVECLQIDRGVTRAELIETARILNELLDGRLRGADLRHAYGAREVRHVTLTRLLPIASEQAGGAEDWPSLPTSIQSAEYADLLERASGSLGHVFDGEHPDAEGARELLEAVADQVAAGGDALREILSIKRYENHTYCHSVNVATLSMMLGKRIGLDESSQQVLAEGALMHDVGKRGVPVEIIRKAGPLNQREWRIMQRHPALGAEILASTGGFSPLTPTIALEHHREVGGGGYPDLGERRPHLMSQIVAVCDTYEALTGARAYRAPLVPDEACLILARMAGTKLNPALVRAFVSLITFFPLGSLVRTTAGEVGVVVQTTENEPLHPVIVAVAFEGSSGDPGARIDTSERDLTGSYVRHILETIPQSAPAADEVGSLAATETAAGDRSGALRPTRWEQGGEVASRAAGLERTPAEA